MRPDVSRPPRALAVVTQLLLGILFLVGLGAIALLPSLSASVAASLPEYAGLRGPLLSMAITLTLVALVALSIVAALVQRIVNASMLTPSSLVLVDGLVAAMGCAAALIVAAFVVIDEGQAGSPPLALAEVTSCLVLMTLACITLVLRSLLRSAIAIRTEPDEVV